MQGTGYSSAWTIALGLVLNASLWIAVFAGFFFCEGHFFRDSYLEAYGLYAPMFPWDHSDTVFFGVNVGLWDILLTILLPVVAATYCVILLIGASSLFKKWRGKIPGKTKAVAKKKGSRMSTADVFVVSCLTPVVAGFILIVLYMTTTSLAAHQGAEAARREIRAQNSCNPTAIQPDEFIVVSVERLVQGVHEHYGGFLVTCSAANCGVRSVATGHTQVVPRDGILRFDTEVDKMEAYLPNRRGSRVQ